MMSRSKVKQAGLNLKMAFTQKRSASLSLVVLVLLLIADVLPVSAVSTSFNPIRGSELQATSTLTFLSDADAQVQENNPSTNFGTSTDLEVINVNNRSIESYIHFTVSGISGT